MVFFLKQIDKLHTAERKKASRLKGFNCVSGNFEAE